MGVAAGMIFVTFEMVTAVFVGADFFSPLSMAGAAVLGQGTLDGPYPPVIAVIVGLPVCVLVSAAYGAAFGAVSAVGPVRRSRRALLAAATAFGSLLWMVDFALAAQGAFPRFPAASSVVQFLAHAFFFGATLGLMLGVRLRDEEPAREQVVAGNRSRGLHLPRAS